MPSLNLVSDVNTQGDIVGKRILNGTEIRLGSAVKTRQTVSYKHDV